VKGSFLTPGVIESHIALVASGLQVAAAGVPNRRKDHAVAMVRFARAINKRMQVLTAELQVLLGPEAGRSSAVQSCRSAEVNLKS
jgi:predicted amidohydrolase YtcJ